MLKTPARYSSSCPCAIAARRSTCILPAESRGTLHESLSSSSLVAEIPYKTDTYQINGKENSMAPNMSLSKPSWLHTHLRPPTNQDQAMSAAANGRLCICSVRGYTQLNFSPPTKSMSSTLTLTAGRILCATCTVVRGDPNASLAENCVTKQTQVREKGWTRLHQILSTKAIRVHT